MAGTTRHAPSAATARPARSESRRTDIRSERVAGEHRREGRFVFIGGRRVVYGSPEYRRLVTVEHRSGPRRYVVIRGQRVIYGSPEYRRLVSSATRQGGTRYVTIRGQRVVYGSPEYRRLTVSTSERRGGTVNANFSEHNHTSVSRSERGEHGVRDHAERGGRDGLRNADTRSTGTRGTNALQQGERGGSQGGIRNASERTGTDRSERGDRRAALWAVSRAVSTVA